MLVEVLVTCLWSRVGLVDNAVRCSCLNRSARTVMCFGSLACWTFRMRARCRSIGRLVRGRRICGPRWFRSRSVVWGVVPAGKRLTLYSLLRAVRSGHDRSGGVASGVVDGGGV